MSRACPQDTPAPAPVQAAAGESHCTKRKRIWGSKSSSKATSVARRAARSDFRGTLNFTDVGAGKGQDANSELPAFLSRGCFPLPAGCTLLLSNPSIASERKQKPEQSHATRPRISNRQLPRTHQPPFSPWVRSAARRSPAFAQHRPVQKTSSANTKRGNPEGFGNPPSPAVLK